MVSQLGSRGRIEAELDRRHLETDLFAVPLSYCHKTTL